MYKVRMRTPHGTWTKWHDWSETPLAALVQESDTGVYDSTLKHEKTGSCGTRGPKQRAAA